MKHRAVLLDTSFFLRFLDEGSPLFKNADAYFRYFLQQEITMMISTISIAEYCVGGEVSELPLLNLQIVPFNLDHSKRTGEFAKVVFNNKGKLKLKERNIKIFNLLKEQAQPKFQFIDLNVPCNQAFGFLDLAI